MMNFRSRKEQIEKEFVRDLVDRLERDGIVIRTRQRSALKKTLKDAAMVGACEERYRTLKLIREGVGDSLGTRITEIPVLVVLGYE